MKDKLMLLVAVLALAGCQSPDVAGRDVAIRGMVETGRTVNKELIKSPLTPGEQALLDASNFQLDAAEKLVNQEK